MRENAKNRLLIIIAAVFAALMFVLPCFFCTTYVARAEGETAQLRVHFVNVLQGDCILIELPDDKKMIIDAGSGTQESATVRNNVLGYIGDTFGSGFKNFDYAILTHTDSDHCNLLDNVLKKYPSYVCYRPNVEATASGYSDPGKSDLSSDASGKPTAAYKNAIAAMYKNIEGVDTKVYVVDPADDSQTITGGEGDGSYSLTFFSPLSKKYSDSNEYSPIMLLEYRGFKFALSGDAEKENEKEFVKKVNDAKTDGVTDKYDMFTADFCVDVFKAGHHGSATSSTQAYLDIMTTEAGAKDVYYVFSCNAEGNKYYHPRQEVLDRMIAMGAGNDKLLRTDHHGSIVFTVADDGSGYALSVSTEVDYTGDNTIGADTERDTGGGIVDDPGDGSDEGSQDPGETDGESGDETGGETGSGSAEAAEPEQTSFWDKLSKPVKIAIIVGIVVAVILIIVVILYVQSKNSKKSKRRKGGKRKGGRR